MSDLQKYLDQALKTVNLNTNLQNTAFDDYDIQEEVADLISFFRTEAGLTQEELAQLTGISQANISKFENRVSVPNIGSLKKIADGLGKRLVVSFVDREEVE